jgi:hypothetical protein
MMIFAAGKDLARRSMQSTPFSSPGSSMSSNTNCGFAAGNCSKASSALATAATQVMSSVALIRKTNDSRVSRISSTTPTRSFSTFDAKGMMESY